MAHDGPFKDAGHGDHGATSTVTLNAQQAAALPASGQTAAQRIAASPRHGEWVAIKVGSSDSVMAWVVYPERSQKAPVVIAIHENTGLNIWTRSVADQLAAEGFIGIAPDLTTMGKTGSLTDETPADPMPDGMMAGVTPGAGKKDEKLKLLPITAFGRYMKVLLSSNEFLFID